MSFSDISRQHSFLWFRQKRIVWFVAGNCTPSVNCIWCVNVCYVGKKHKKMSISSQKERQRSWVEALDQNNTQSRKISEENVLPPKLWHLQMVWYSCPGYGWKPVSPVSCIFSVTLSRGRTRAGGTWKIPFQKLTAQCSLPENSRKVLKSTKVHIEVKNARDKFIVIIINWSLIGSRFALAPYCSFSVLLQVQISFIITIFVPS